MKFSFSKIVLLGGFSMLLIQGNDALAQISSQELIGQENTITTAVPFLSIGPDSRAGGMGEVGVATDPDNNSIHWNAAKLAFADRPNGMSLSYIPWLRSIVNDIALSYLSGYFKIDENQAIGGSLRYFSLGNITFTDNQAQSLGDYKPNEFAIDGAYSRKLNEHLSAGVALRYIYSNLTNGVDNSNSGGSKAGTSVAADVSAYYTTFADINGHDTKISAGLNISNIGSKISYIAANGRKDYIPTNLRLGAAAKYPIDEFNAVGFSVDINKLMVPTPNPADSTRPDKSLVSAMFSSFNDAPGGMKEEFQEIIYNAGVEYWYDNQFAVRAGYFHEAANKGNRQFVTLGAGVRYNVFNLDVSYLIPTATSTRNPLENTLRFTLGFNFNSGGASKEAAPAAATN